MANIPEPRFEFIRNSLCIRLIEDWIYCLDGVLPIIVPKGFETDLASIPRIFHPIMSPQGNLRYGSLPHDFGFQYGFLLSPYSPKQVYNKASLKLRREHSKAFGQNIPVYIGKPQQWFDEHLKYVTIEATGKKLQAKIAYSILRCFGFVAWNKYRNFGPAAYNQNSLWLPGV